MTLLSVRCREEEHENSFAFCFSRAWLNAVLRLEEKKPLALNRCPTVDTGKLHL